MFFATDFFATDFVVVDRAIASFFSAGARVRSNAAVTQKRRRAPSSHQAWQQHRAEAETVAA